MIQKGPTTGRGAGKVPSSGMPPWGAQAPRLLTEHEEAFGRKMVAALGSLTSQIDELDGRAAAAGKKVSREFAELLAPLRWRVEALQRRIDRFFGDEVEGWDSFRDEAFARFHAETEETWSDLTRHLHEVQSIFRRRHPQAGRRPMEPARLRR